MPACSFSSRLIIIISIVLLCCLMFLFTDIEPSDFSTAIYNRLFSQQLTDLIENDLSCNLFSTKKFMKSSLQQQQQSIRANCRCPSLSLINKSIMPASCSHIDHFQFVDQLLNNLLTYCELAALQTYKCFACETFQECLTRDIFVASTLPLRCRNSQLVTDILEQTISTSPTSTSTSSSSSSSASSDSSNSSNSIEYKNVLSAIIDHLGQSDLIRIAKRSSCTSSASSSSTTKPSELYGKRKVYSLFDHRLQVTVYKYYYAVPSDWVIQSINRHKIFSFTPLDSSLFRANNNSTKKGYSLDALSNQVGRSMLEHSFFSLILGRHGFSSARLIEHLASGIVPIFVDLDECISVNRNRGNPDSGCLPGVPLDLLQQAHALPGVKEMMMNEEIFYQHFGLALGAKKRESLKNHSDPLRRYYSIIKPGKVNWNIFDENEYYLLANKMLNYTRDYFTSKSVTEYYLQILSRQEDSSSSSSSSRSSSMFSNFEGKTALVVLPHHDPTDAVSFVGGLIELGINVVLAETPHNKDLKYPMYLKQMDLVSLLSSTSSFDVLDFFKKADSSNNTSSGLFKTEKKKNLLFSLMAAIESNKLKVKGRRGAGFVFPFNCNAKMLSVCEPKECAKRLKRSASSFSTSTSSDSVFDFVFYFMIQPSEANECETNFHSRHLEDSKHYLLKEIRDSNLGKKRVAIIETSERDVMLKPYMASFATLFRREDPFDQTNSHLGINASIVYRKTRDCSRS